MSYIELDELIEKILSLCFGNWKNQVLDYMYYLLMFVDYQNKHIKNINKRSISAFDKNKNKPGWIHAISLTVVNFKMCKWRLATMGVLLLLYGSLHCFIFISMSISFFLFWKFKKKDENISRENQHIRLSKYWTFKYHIWTSIKWEFCISKHFRSPS